jgi:hypothetical protein
MKVQFSAHLYIPVQFAKMVGPIEKQMPNFKPLHLVIQHCTSFKLALLHPKVAH